MAYKPYPQKEGSVGIAIIITNGYEGEYSLPGTQDDGTKWKEALETLKFDVRWERNITKDATIQFLRAASRTPIVAKSCHYVVFVFCGHGKKGALYSQDLREIDLEREVLPFFFDKSNLKAVEKLIYLDACRSCKDRRYLSLSDALSKVWNPGLGSAGYFSLCSTPSGYWARDGSNGSAFSDIVTRKLIERLTLREIVDITRELLHEEAQRKKIEYINPVFEDNLGPNSEKTLLNLSVPVGHSKRHPLDQPGYSGRKRSPPSGDLEESDLEFTASELFEKKNRSKLAKSKPNEKRSYSNVSVEFVVRKITRKKLHSGIKSMLSEHRTELLHDDRKLINESCKDSILGLLENRNYVKAANELIDYFKKTHTGEELLIFSDFLRQEAEDDGRNQQLLNLAESIEDAVYTASPEDQ